MALFIDPDSEAISLDESSKKGLSNVPLAKLSLDRLGAWNRFLRSVGRMSSLYVTKIESDTMPGAIPYPEGSVS